MTENLIQHRGAPSVWEDRRPVLSLSRCDAEWWLASASAAALLMAGLRRRSAAGLMLAMGGAGLAWWAAHDTDDRRSARGRLQAKLRRRSTADDVVHEAAEESFPASDAPAWTPTIGHVGAENRGR